MSILENKLTWSKTRDEVFHDCLRKYFFQYYGSWGGWDRSATARVREAYLLKKLQSRQMWAGDKVHRCIRTVVDAMRTGEGHPDVDVVVAGLLDGMRQDYRDSSKGLYRGDPKKYCALFEHEYQISLPGEVWKENARNAEECVRNFYRSEVFQKLQALAKEDWLEVEQLATFQIDETEVFVQLDLAFRDGDRVIIYDWKTGKPERSQNEIQLACYAAYAVEKYGVTPEQVTAAALYLADNSEHAHTIDDSTLDTIRQYIRDSLDEMRFVLEDPDKNVAVEDAFDYAEDEVSCMSCNFKKICPRWTEAGAPPSV